MSFYSLQPFADVACKESLHAYWENGFSEDELNKIISIGENKITTQGEEAIVGLMEGSGVNTEIRRSRVAWFNSDEASWLYQKLGWIARQLNGQYFQCDVSGFSDDLQYTIYDHTVEGHYDWHMDKGYASDGSPPRKLSLVLLLSDPNEYEGGDLELFAGNQTVKVQKTKGIVHAFPSYVMHRVTPVTKGTRRSLVVWLCGPKWR
jgi:PKHD-type hydroxylase